MLLTEPPKRSVADPKSPRAARKERASTQRRGADRRARDWSAARSVPRAFATTWDNAYRQAAFIASERAMRLDTHDGAALLAAARGGLARRAVGVDAPGTRHTHQHAHGDVEVLGGDAVVDSSVVSAAAGLLPQARREDP